MDFGGPKAARRELQAPKTAPRNGAKSGSSPQERPTGTDDGLRDQLRAAKGRHRSGKRKPDRSTSEGSAESVRSAAYLAPSEETASGNGQVLVAFAPFEAGGPGQLSLSNGERLRVVGRLGGWWKAIKADGTVGIAPGNYCKLVEAGPSVGETSI